MRRGLSKGALSYEGSTSGCLWIWPQCVRGVGSWGGHRSVGEGGSRGSDARGSARGADAIVCPLGEAKGGLRALRAAQGCTLWGVWLGARGGERTPARGDLGWHLPTLRFTPDRRLPIGRAP